MILNHFVALFTPKIAQFAPVSRLGRLAGYAYDSPGKRRSWGGWVRSGAPCPRAYHNGTLRVRQMGRMGRIILHGNGDGMSAAGESSERTRNRPEFRLHLSRR